MKRLILIILMLSLVLSAYAQDEGDTDIGGSSECVMIYDREYCHIVEEITPHWDDDVINLLVESCRDRGVYTTDDELDQLRQCGEACITIRSNTYCRDYMVSPCSDFISMFFRECVPDESERRLREGMCSIYPGSQFCDPLNPFPPIPIPPNN